ncbi:5713_t:CDS:2 [Paraglomus brasilianum]|uniref:5713_t:CDS:1 n=1 Tax=Paraglomus brasilianum TaxID=144538 RepID=A0A9N9F296_9GLOM|nr:5713_t:CDS:2 [Paraglomus brasilianum]
MSVNAKKLLANQIKEDLQKDLEKVKKEGWSSGKRDLIAPSELEKEDYDQIVSLIEEIRTTGEKVSEQKEQEENARIDQKLSSNPKMFFYEGIQE